jgi:Domain of unknown function (DUF4262)
MKKHRHPTACQCARGAAITAGATPAEADAKIQARDADLLKRYGWLAHIVTDDPASPTGFNWHTHGLQERYDHRDFQIVCPLLPNVAHQIGATLADRVKAGETFGSGQKLAQILRGEMLIKLIAATECGRPVLRVILPDRAGKLDLGEIDEQFARQYEDLGAEAGPAPPVL